MNSLRKLVLIWMLGWLPLSGAMAAAMPIAGMPGGAASSKLSAMSADVETSDAATIISSLPCHTAAASSDSEKTGTCTHCVLCHLAVSLMLPCIPDFQGLTPSHNFAAAPLLPHASFIPELASPPPRSPAH